MQNEADVSQGQMEKLADEPPALAAPPSPAAEQFDIPLSVEAALANMAQGHGYFDNGDYHTAATFYRLVLRKSLNEPQVISQLGECISKGVPTIPADQNFFEAFKALQQKKRHKHT